ncbi:MAG: hypothetical protein JNM84_04735 [Planctomycetes bacterium]|nr:hypothetical protein [Planctomycetota bacterium]
MMDSSSPRAHAVRTLGRLGAVLLFGWFCGGALAPEARAHGGVVMPPPPPVDLRAKFREARLNPPPPRTAPGAPSSGTGPESPAGPEPAPGPTTPKVPGSGPTGQPAPGARTGAGLDVSLPNDAWDHWWVANRPRFLELQAHRRRLAQPLTGDQAKPVGALDAALRDEIGALLHAVLRADKGTSVDERSAALIAAAKLGWKSAETRELFLRDLRSPVQEIRETATLALGLLGDESALPLLAALARDASLAHSVTGERSIDDRTRAFAAYGMALLVRRSEPEKARTGTEIARATLNSMLDGSLSSRPELESAAIHALSVLPLGERDAWTHALPLLESIVADSGRHAFVKAQVPTALGRLLGPACAEKLSLWIEDPATDWMLRDSAELIAGRLTLAPLAKTRMYVSLKTAYERNAVPGERAFAILGSARLEDAETLRRYAEQASEGAHLDRPWIALGLGLAARSLAARGTEPVALREALRTGFRRAKAAEVRGAFAVAAGLARDTDAAELLRRAFVASTVTRERGHLAVGLGLMGDASSREMLREALPRAVRDPEELGEIAIALVLLQDRDATPRLLEMLAEGRTISTLGPLATALGRLGGADAARALLALATDPKRTDLLQAYAIVGLGICIEEQDLPWATAFAEDFNYLVAPPTLYGTSSLLTIL